MTANKIPKKVIKEISELKNEISAGALKNIKKLKFLLKKYDLYNKRAFSLLIYQGKKVLNKKKKQDQEKFYQYVDSISALKFSDKDFKIILQKRKKDITNSKNPLEYTERVLKLIVFLKEIDLYSDELFADILGKDYKNILSLLFKINKNQ